MSSDRTYPLKLIFKGKDARDGLELYDGATSFLGFAKAIQIVTNAYSTGKPSGWATTMRGGKIKFGAPRKGSVIFDLRPTFLPIKDAAPTSPAYYYDFLDVAFRRATGSIDYQAETAFVRNKLDEDETFFDVLAEKIEGPLQDAHRIIDRESVTASLERPRSGILMFNSSTSEWVKTRDVDPNVKRYTGNVTRYNSISGNGRAYINEIQKIVPIRPSDNFTKKGLLTWSLHGDNVKAGKKLEFFGKKVESARQDVKRLIVFDCNNLES